VAFSPDGKTLAAGYGGVVRGGRRGGVVLFDAATRRHVSELSPAVKEGYVWSVAFRPDGVDGVGGVVLFDAATGRRLSAEPLAVKEGFVQSVAFSPEGKTLAAGYFGVPVGGVVLFDAATGRRLSKEPLAVKGNVRSVAFSPDGKTLATNGGGGVVLWDVDLSSWQGLAGTIANRNLTRAEWRQYLAEEGSYRPTFPDLTVPPEDAASASTR
jgi:WD40 repeat protein